jgi:hypothetical protein
MPRRKRSNLIDYVRLCFNTLKALGAEPALFLLVAIGAFSALLRGVSPGWVFGVSAVVIGGWLATRIINAYLYEREQDRILQKIKLTEGVRLLELHKDRQRALPLGRRGNGHEPSDDNDA